MLIQTIIDTLNRLKLYGIAAALAEQLTQSAATTLAFEERLGLLVEREVLYRDNRRLTRLLQLAQLKQRNACVDLAFDALKGYVEGAVTALGDLLQSDNEAIRRGVANDVLNHILKARELEEIEERLASIERLVYEKRTYRR